MARRYLSRCPSTCSTAARIAAGPRRSKRSPAPSSAARRATAASSAFAANTSGTALTVLVGGTLVPLPDGQLLSPDITVNGANTVFTVTNAGRYQISYNVNTTASLASGTRLLINGAANTASTVAPAVSLSHFSNEILLNLNAGDTVSLQMFGIASVATLLPGSAGAALSITRLS